MKTWKPGVVLFAAAALFCGRSNAPRQPVIDIHLHSASPQDLENGGPSPVTGRKAPRSVEEHVRSTLAEMDRFNIVLGIVSGRLDEIQYFSLAAPDRIWSGLARGIPGLDIEMLWPLYRSGRLKVMGEIGAQYSGLSPSDPVLEPYFALAESSDVPACIHMGSLGPPGVTEWSPKYRAAVGNPLQLEEMLNRHPKCRIWIAHLGFPFFEETVAVLNVYPRVYLDTSAVDWAEAGFIPYLKKLIEYGFADRIMFGSDQGVWPDVIGPAVESIEKADFLTAKQKRDILYNNAARFLRLAPEQIAEHHGASMR